MPPRVQLALRARLAAGLRDKGNEDYGLGLAIGQTGQDVDVLLERFQSCHWLGIGQRSSFQKTLDAEFLRKPVRAWRP